MKKIFTFLLSIAMLVATCDILYARGGSSFGGSRSSGSSWSKPSSSKPSSNWSSKPSSSARPSPSVSKPSTAATKSKEAVQTKGKSFSSKSEATAQFKKDNTAKYTSKFTKEPSSRPSHIPQSTKVGNQNVNITYNSTYGGYGYMHPTLGTWMMYDAMSDAVMLSVLMNQNHYNVVQPSSNTTVAVVESHWSWMTIIFISLVVGVIILVFSIIIYNEMVD